MSSAPRLNVEASTSSNAQNDDDSRAAPEDGVRAEDDHVETAAQLEAAAAALSIGPRDQAGSASHTDGARVGTLEAASSGGAFVEFSVQNHAAGGKRMTFKVPGRVRFNKSFEHLEKKYRMSAGNLLFFLGDRPIDPERSIQENGIRQRDCVDIYRRERSHAAASVGEGHIAPPLGLGAAAAASGSRDHAGSASHTDGARVGTLEAASSDGPSIEISLRNNAAGGKRMSFKVRGHVRFNRLFEHLEKKYRMSAGNLLFFLGDRPIDPEGSIRQNGVEGGDCINVYRRESLHAAVRVGDSQAALRLLTEGADADAKDADGVTPLQLACRLGPERVAMAAIKASKVTNKAANGSALLWCCSNGYEKAGCLLLKRGADCDVDARSPTGWTPLLLCCKNGCQEAALALIERGVKVTAALPGDLTTALHFAVKKNADRVVPALLQAGADPNAQDADGDSPLHIACQEGCELAARLLVEAGADVKLRNKAGHRPTSFAKWIHKRLDRFDYRYYSRYHSWREPFNLSRALKEKARALLGRAAGARARGAGMVGRKRKGSHDNGGEPRPVRRRVTYADSDRFAQVLGIVSQRGFGANVFNAAFCCSSTYTEENLWRGLESARRHAAKDNEGPAFPTTAEPSLIPRSRTALMAAARFGRIDRLKWLLGLGCDVNAQELGRRGGHYQRRGGKANNWWLLRPFGANTALHFAAVNGHRRVVELLLQAGADPNKRRADLMTPLLLAARGGFSSIVELLLKAGADSNALQPCNEVSSLHIAAYKGNVTMARYLLRHNANAKARTRHSDDIAGGYTPLHSAVAGRNIPSINVIHERSCHNVLDARNSATWSTPLLFSLQRGAFAVAERLVACGANVNRVDENGNTALHMLARTSRKGASDADLNARKGLLYSIIGAGGDVNEMNWVEESPLELAAKGRCEVTAFHFLNAGADPKDAGALMAACENGMRRLAVRLVAGGAPLSALDGRFGRYRYPLEAAAASGNLELVRDLLDAGADVKVGYALDAAASHSHSAIGLYLLSRGARVSSAAVDTCCSSGLEDLAVAIARAAGTVQTSWVRLARQAGHHGLARKLLELASASKLHQACEAGDEATALALIASGADCSALDVDKLAPLQRALLADEPSNAIATALLGAGADVEAKGSTAEPPLWLACKRGLTAIARLLLEKGADASGIIPGADAKQRALFVDAGSCSGHILLFYCACNNDLELARLLIEKGADPLVGVGEELGYSAPSTPFEVARLRRHFGMEELLKSALKGRGEPERGRGFSRFLSRGFAQQA